MQNRFLNPQTLLSEIPLVSGMVVADFGCGNGYYSIAAASKVGQKGQVFAIDIMPDALSQTATLAKMEGLRNIVMRQCDLEKFGACDMPEISCDLVIAGSILHQMKNKDNAMREAYRVLKTGGQILVVEWLPEAKLGPASQDRLPASEVKNVLEKNGFRPVKELPAGAFHYAWLYSK